MSGEPRILSLIFRLILFVALLGGIAICFYMTMEGKLTDRESTMLNVFIAMLSILASWIFTDFYASAQAKALIRDVREEHRSNLRTYALKAAEKVNNLSNELNKMAIYLDDELNYTDYRTTEEELMAKEERIESAIHLIRALKSINDTGLSDWEGVIGEELNQQREEKEEKEENLREIVARVEAVIDEKKSQTIPAEKYGELATEISELERDLRLAVLQLSNSTVPKRVRKKEPKHKIVGNCPVCTSDILYSQRSSERSYKSVNCSGCGTKLISTYTPPAGFQLKRRLDEEVLIACPSCKAQNSGILNNLPGSFVSIKCSDCGSNFRANRSMDGVETKVLTDLMPMQSSGPKLSEEVIEKVRSHIPPQPWPTGMHHFVAAELGLTSRIVQRATQELIGRGVFLPQINGVLYEPVKPKDG